MERKILPVGESSFEIIRGSELEYYYVDKTPFIYDLTRPPWPPKFLSRPRRFGKSLFLDTLRCLYEGKKELFEGLYIYDKWDWEKVHPVIKLDFTLSTPETYDEFVLFYNDYLEDEGSFYGWKPLENVSFATNFASFIRYVSRVSSKKIVVLVDEYDSFFTSSILNASDKNRLKEEMKNLLRTIKASRQQIEFVMVTGILRLSQIEFFSAANIFQDISLEGDYNDICGYTEEELYSTFAPEFERKDLSPDVTKESMKYWYDGYRWMGKNHLYNPNDVLFTFKKRHLGNWWTQYGISTLAVNAIKARGGIDVEHCDISIAYESLELGVDFDHFELAKTLFQTGYLTNKSPFEEYLLPTSMIDLGVPNFEVKSSLSYLNLFVKLQLSKKDTDEVMGDVRDAMKKNNFESLKKAIQSVFAKITYDEKPEKMREADFRTLVRGIFMGAGFCPLDEVPTQKGRADMVISANRAYYVMEFKVLENSGRGAALRQIKEKEYGKRYATDGPVHLLGFEFTYSGIDCDLEIMPSVTLVHLDVEQMVVE